MKKKTLAIVLIVLLGLSVLWFGTSFVVAQLDAPTTAGVLLDTHSFFVDQWQFLIDNIVALLVIVAFLVVMAVLALIFLLPKRASKSGYKPRTRSRKASKK